MEVAGAQVREQHCRLPGGHQQGAGPEAELGLEPAALTVGLGIPSGD